jgi:hypothetical protein
MRKAPVPLKQNAARNRPQAERRAQTFPYLTAILWFCITLGIVCRFVGLKWDWDEDKKRWSVCTPTSAFSNDSGRPALAAISERLLSDGQSATQPLQ